MLPSDLSQLAEMRALPDGYALALTETLTCFRVPKQRYRKGQSYALRYGDRTILIDAVHELTREAVNSTLRVRPAAALLLTHSDLLGQGFGSPRALSEWLGGAPVLIHSYDAGRHQHLHPLESNGPLLADLRMDFFLVAGHTPGSVAYLHGPSGYLFTGDIIVGNNYERDEQSFSHPPIKDSDWDRYAAGWEAIPGDRVAAVLPLHGQPSFGPDGFGNAKAAGTDRQRVMEE